MAAKKKEEPKYTIEKSVEPSTVSVYQLSTSPISGLAATVIFTLRPITNLLLEQVEKLVDAGFMSRVEAVGWVNLHLNLIGSNLKNAGPCSIIAYAPWDQTLVTISSESTSAVGYTATHWMIQTAYIAVDDPDVQARRQERWEKNERKRKAIDGWDDGHTSAVDADPITPEEIDDPFLSAFSDLADVDVESLDPPIEEGEIWRSARFDDVGILGKIEEAYRTERRLTMARAAADIARGRVQAARRASASADDESFDLNSLFGDGEFGAELEGSFEPEKPKVPDAREVLNEKRTRDLAKYLITDPDQADGISAFFLRRGGVQRKFLGGGRGGLHDLKQDAQKSLARDLKNDLVEAGLDTATAKQFSAGFKASDGSGDVEAMFGEGGAKLDAKGSNSIFQQAMEACEAKARKSYAKTVGPKGAGWDKADSSIRWVLSDLEFEGQWVAPVKARIGRFVQANDPEGMLEVMEDRSFWVDNPPPEMPPTSDSKFGRRITFLKNAIKMKSTEGRKVRAKREAEAREQARHEEEIAEAIKHRDAGRLKAELAKKKGGTPTR